MTRFLKTFSFLILQGIRDIGLHKYSQFFTYIATTLIIFICGLALMLISTVKTELQDIREEVVFHIYWKNKTDMNVVNKQWLAFDTLPHLSKKETYSPKQAYLLLEKRIIPSNVISKEQQNAVLPATAILFFSPKDITDIPEWIKQTKTTLEALPNVERVFNSPFKDKFSTMWIHLYRYVILPIIILLFISLALIIGNTVALSLHSRKTEVEILHLIGAPEWYILFPLITTSFIQALMGSLSATGMLYITYIYFKDILYLPPLVLELHFPSMFYVTLLFVLPICIGLLGTFFSVKTKTIH
ncbi:MAG: cell division protein FtsX [Desulfovibrionaceae bacterium]